MQDYESSPKARLLAALRLLFGNKAVDADSAGIKVTPGNDWEKVLKTLDRLFCAFVTAYYAPNGRDLAPRQLEYILILAPAVSEASVIRAEQAAQEARYATRQPATTRR